MSGGLGPEHGAPDLWWIDRDTEAIWRGEDAAVDVARASTIAWPAHRTRFLLARRAMRRILATYLFVPPADVPIHVAANGKPLLPPSSGLAFSISHSAHWTGVAVARAATIGLDVVDHAVFASHGAAAITQVANAREIDVVAGSPNPDAMRCRLWARKEALGKALGSGLLGDLTKLDVGLGAVPERSEINTSSDVLHIVDCFAPDDMTASLCATPPLRAVRLKDYPAGL